MSKILDGQDGLEFRVVVAGAAGEHVEVWPLVPTVSVGMYTECSLPNRIPFAGSIQGLKTVGA